MAYVVARKDENINVLIARFKNECIRSNISKLMKKQEAYFPPSVIKHERKCKIKHFLKLERIKEQNEELLKKQGRNKY